MWNGGEENGIICAMSNPDFPVIDAHVHVYPNSVAAKVTPDLARRFGNAPSFDGTIPGCRAKDAASFIAASVNLPVATRPESVSRTNNFWADYSPGGECVSPADEPPVRIFSLASLHPLVADKEAELERIASLGFSGVKLHPEYQRFRFNDPSMDDTWAFLAERGLVAYLHAGGERVFEPPFHSSPAEIALLQRRFPKLKIIAAHLGGFGMWDEAEATLVGTTVNLDLSHTFFWMPHDRILRMIKAHTPRHIVFGTDAPWQDPGKVLEAFLALPLDDDARRAICHDNAARLLALA